MHPSNGAQGGPPPNGSLVHSQPGQAGSARLADLLDFIKAEFEQLAGEGSQLRAQREEFEGMSESSIRFSVGRTELTGICLLTVNHHANELNAMRAMSYDLERKHLEDKRR